MHKRLENQTTTIGSATEFQTMMNNVEHELRDLCIVLEVQTVQDLLLSQSEDIQPCESQSEAIHTMLQSLKTRVNAKAEQNADPLNDSGDHQYMVCELLSEIDHAKKRVGEMDHTLENEVLCRKQSEMQCIAREESLAWAKKQIQSLEQRIQDMDETCQLKIREVKDLETQLQQVKGQQHKSESKYERALIEIESCK
jgi:chromosome segregation ATPase